MKKTGIFICIMLLLLISAVCVCAAQEPVAQVVKSDGTVLESYNDFETGLAVVENGVDCYLQLLCDVQTDATVTGTVYLDLNGYDLTGLSVSGTLYGMDSSTDQYDGVNAGILRLAAGKPQITTKFVRRYLCVEDAGSYSFHRFYVGITHMTLRPSTYGVGYKAYFAGDAQVKAALSGSNAFGYDLWLEEGGIVRRGYNADQFTGGREVTLRIDNFISSNRTTEENLTRARMDVHASAYVRFADGTVINSAAVCYNLQDMTELVDAQYSSLSKTNRNAYLGLVRGFSEMMIGWDIPNTHHTSGTIWKSVNASGFKALLTKHSSTTYRIAPGHYVLTEDVDLGNVRMRVMAGTTVSICLNGHSITGTNRFFEQYGNLNICDCHADAQEGSMISSYAGETAMYAPIMYCRFSSVTNIYGGKLSGNGKVTAAGVIAVSHDGTDKTKPSAILNIYGGTIHNGQSYSNGGLISMWNGGIVNMYGGTLRDGIAVGRGGAVDASSGAFKMYGGKICNNTAPTGAGLYIAGDTILADGEITGNTGHGVYLTKADAELRGKLKVYGNTGNQLVLEYNSAVNTDGLKNGADVHLNPTGITILGTKEQGASYATCDTEGFSIKKIGDRMVIATEDMVIPGAVEGFQVGYGVSNITPPVINGMPLQGYSNATSRLAVDEGRKEYDDLMAQSIAITDENGNTVIMIYCDLIDCHAEVFDFIAIAVSAATGVPKENVFFNLSHSHSVPSILTDMPIVTEYNRFLMTAFAESAVAAMNDRAPATMETGSFEVQQLVNGKMQYYNFYRHYTTEVNGVLQYFGDQFGTAVYNSTTKPIRDADHTMHLVRFVRDGKDILLSNWRIHPHFTGGEKKYLISADAIGTIRYYMQKNMPDTHFVYFQGAAGNMNESSRLTETRAKTYGSPVQHHGLGYVKYGETVASIIVNNLDCLQPVETGLVQVDHCDYLAKADNPTTEEYQKAKAVYDVMKKETAGMSLSQKNTWVQNYCKEYPEYDYASYTFITFLVDRRYNQKDRILPLNVVSIGKDFAFFTGPFELWDSISMEVEERSPFKTTFCLGYSMDHQHYMVYYPEYLDEPNGVPYISYECENRHFKAPTTVCDMIEYWDGTLNKLYENAA